MQSRLPNRRRKQLSHRPLQGALVRRAMLHWLLTLVSITACTLLLWLLFGAGYVGVGGSVAAVLSVWKPFVFVLLGALGVLPAIVMDLLKITNRVAGPLVKLNRALAELGRGESIRPIQFREGDYCPELAESFNTVLARVQRLEAAQAELEQKLAAATMSVE